MGKSSQRFAVLFRRTSASAAGLAGIILTALSLVATPTSGSKDDSDQRQSWPIRLPAKISHFLRAREDGALNTPKDKDDIANAVLVNATCSTSTDCWAVGCNACGSEDQTIICHWDGQAWSVFPSPNVSDRYNDLSGVACPAPSDCWAVGSHYGPGLPPRTLILHWDGNTWAIVDSPNSSPVEHNLLNGVTCNSPSDCWAVGNRQDQTLTTHWNGSSWAIVSSPGTGGDNDLLAVACNSASDCWTVGYQGSEIHTVIEHWNGSSWSVVSSPNPSTYNSLYDLTCTASDACWAVGHSDKGAGGNGTFVLKWNGISWSVANSPHSYENSHEST